MKFYLTRLFSIASIILSGSGLRFLPDDKLVYYGPTANNQKVLRALFAALDEPTWGHPDHVGQRPSIWWRLHFVATKAGTLHTAAKLMSQHRNVHPFAAVKMLQAGAVTAFYYHTLTQGKRAAIVFANDHAPDCVAMRMASTTYGIKTIYRQHAPVSTEFLPLEFDLSIIFDEVTVNRYAHVAPIPGNTVIWSQFETPFQDMVIPTAVRTAGVCLSLVWETQPTKDVLEALLQQDGITDIWIRPHPANKRDLSELRFDPRIKIAEKDQSVADYCIACDVTIVPTSGIALEILHFGVPALYIASEADFDFDGYDFVSEGILPHVSIDSLRNLLSEVQYFDEDWKKRFEKFDGTVGGPPTAEPMRRAVSHLIEMKS